MPEIGYVELKGYAYQNLIEKAIARSDIVEFEVYWPKKEFSFYDKSEMISSKFTEKHYDIRYEYVKNDFIFSRNLFEKNCMPFLRELEPYFLDGKTLADRCLTYHMPSVPELIPILSKPQRLTNWGDCNYPENLAFGKDGKYWFWCTNHGTYNANLCPDNIEDYKYWQLSGINFYGPFNYDLDVLQRPNMYD